mmetsp:Transcript_140362/g.448622  ORF Transcript_140362/g.448622 Transcript_140362/m.448622 type:complete len:205 (-) Transcript_140362:2863-3477(-)
MTVQCSTSSILSMPSRTYWDLASTASVQGPVERVRSAPWELVNSTLPGSGLHCCVGETKHHSPFMPPPQAAQKVPMVPSQGSFGCAAPSNNLAAAAAAAGAGDRRGDSAASGSASSAAAGSVVRPILRRRCRGTRPARRWAGRPRRSQHQAGGWRWRWRRRGASSATGVAAQAADGARAGTGKRGMPPADNHFLPVRRVLAQRV